jgi:hypothetical protein
VTWAAQAFVDAGLLAAEAGGLPTALDDLAVRLDLAEAGELLSMITEAGLGPTPRLRRDASTGRGLGRRRRCGGPCGYGGCRGAGASGARPQA